MTAQQIPSRYRKRPTLRVLTDNQDPPAPVSGPNSGRNFSGGPVSSSSRISSRSGPSSGGPISAVISGPNSGTSEPVSGPGPLSAGLTSIKHELSLELPTQSVSLVVSESDTVKDVIQNIANIHRYELGSDPEGIVLWENVQQYNIRRPLRGKEYFKHILSSWEAEARNYLSITPSQSRLDTHSLAFLNPRRDIAKDPNFHVLDQIYWKNAKGDWKHVVVHVDSEGQLTITKSSKQLFSLLVNEFDIYEVQGKFKSPKSCVVALRSQQNPQFFMDKSDSLHYFSVDDGKDFDTLKNTVFTLRSQLVDKTSRLYADQLSGNSLNSAGTAITSFGSGFNSTFSSTLGSPVSAASGSPNICPPSGGSFSPLLSANNGHGMLNLHADTMEDPAISTDGLLGRTYSSRKAHYQHQFQQQQFYRINDKAAVLSADQILKPNSLLDSISRSKLVRNEVRGVRGGRGDVPRLPNHSMVVAHGRL